MFFFFFFLFLLRSCHIIYRHYFSFFIHAYPHCHSSPSSIPHSPSSMPIPIILHPHYPPSPLSPPAPLRSQSFFLSPSISTRIPSRIKDNTDPTVYFLFFPLFRFAFSRYIHPSTDASSDPRGLSPPTSLPPPPPRRRFRAEYMILIPNPPFPLFFFLFF